MTHTEALRLALDALETVTRHFTRAPSTLADSTARGAAHAAIEACRAALAAPAAVPVAWSYDWIGSEHNPHFMVAGEVADGLRLGNPPLLGPDSARTNWTPLYAAPAAPSVPPGWKLVPVEPTDAMVDATHHGQPVSDIWRDMLAAAPTDGGQG